MSVRAKFRVTSITKTEDQSMSVRAKFRVTSITKTCYAANATDSCSVKLSAVSDPANATWSKWTPSGSLEMTINNPEALEQFKIGEYYFLDFTPAAAKEADEAK